ncbi:MAG: SAM-dependent methyltransferase [Synechococcales bacterium]|nr:SAM-dependent methyltransferase [Synechococcales bacterium]
MVASPQLRNDQSLKKVFFCPEESSFYAHCLETLVLKECFEPTVIVEFGSGDGSPVIQALLRTEFDGVIHGFEINDSAYQVARSRIQEHQLTRKYLIHKRCLLNSPKPEATYLIANPPYLPAWDHHLYQPLLHGGIEGITLTKKLLSLGYPNVLTLMSSYSHPQDLVREALLKHYRVASFVVAPMQFGYYSSEPKVMARIKELRSCNRAFYSENIYLLAGVLFTQQPGSRDLSTELLKLMTSL